MVSENLLPFTLFLSKAHNIFFKDFHCQLSVLILKVHFFMEHLLVFFLLSFPISGLPTGVYYQVSFFLDKNNRILTAVPVVSKKPKIFGECLCALSIIWVSTFDCDSTLSTQYTQIISNWISILACIDILIIGLRSKLLLTASELSLFISKERVKYN